MLMIAVGLFFAAVLLVMAILGISFIIVGVQALLSRELDGLLCILFGGLLILGAAILAVIFFVSA